MKKKNGNFRNRVVSIDCYRVDETKKKLKKKKKHYTPSWEIPLGHLAHGLLALKDNGRLRRVQVRTAGGRDASITHSIM